MAVAAPQTPLRQLAWVMSTAQARAGTTLCDAGVGALVGAAGWRHRRRAGCQQHGYTTWAWPRAYPKEGLQLSSTKAFGLQWLIIFL